MIKYQKVMCMSNNDNIKNGLDTKKLYTLKRFKNAYLYFLL